MGIFSKPKKETSVPDDQIKLVIEKFQGWTISYIETEINGKKVSPAELRDLVAYVVKASIAANDEHLLQWTSKACVSMESAKTDIAPVDVMAQVIFDVSAHSLTLRKKYQTHPQLLEAITTLGVAAYKVSEEHPQFKEILEYMRTNSSKLSGN
jgi:hypothetical protein